MTIACCVKGAVFVSENAKHIMRQFRHVLYGNVMHITLARLGIS